MVMRTFYVSAGTASGEWIPLSVYDLLTGHFYTEQALFFERPLDGEALRASLAKTLRRFPVLAGRITTDEQGREGVLCNDAGAQFIETAAAQAMPAFRPAAPAKPVLRQYVKTSYPLPGLTRSPAPLIVKLTQMASGGSALGVAIDHTLADGFSAATFLRGWSQIHRGEPMSEQTHDRRQFEALALAAAPGSDKSNDHFCLVSRLDKLRFFARLIGGGRRLGTWVVRLSASEVQALKGLANDELRASERWASTSDAVTAHIWKRLAMMRGRPADSVESLGLLSDVRARLAPELSKTYFGNVVSNTKSSLRAETLRSQSLGQLALRIRQSRDENTRQKLCAEIAFLSACREAGRSKHVMPRLMSEGLDRLVLMNDYSKLPFYEVDFGGGTPFWYDMAMGPIPWQVIVAPTPERDGGRDLHLCLPRDKFNPDLLRS